MTSQTPSTLSTMAAAAEVEAELSCVGSLCSELLDAAPTAPSVIRSSRGPTADRFALDIDGPWRCTKTIMRARCHSHSEQLCRRYDCQPPHDHHVQLDHTVHADPLLHPIAPPTAAAAPSPSPDEKAASDDSDADCGDEFGGDYARAFEHSTTPDVSDPDIKAAKRAQHHTRNGHMQKAARVLHSTAAMADLRQPQVRTQSQPCTLDYRPPPLSLLCQTAPLSRSWKTMR